MPEDDSPERDAEVSALVSDLRRLRRRAGYATLVHLSQRTGLSKSALSEAFKGDKLPSERTLDLLIRTFGEDPDPWLDRRAALISSAKPPSDVPSPDEPFPPLDPVPSPTPTMRRRILSIRVAVLLAAIAFGAGAAAGAAVATGVAFTIPRDTADADTHPTPKPSKLPAATGVDPAATDCIDDAEPAASETRIETVILEVMWSDKCQAAWGRITRNDNQSNGNSVYIEVYPLGPERDSQRQDGTIANVQGAYTDMIVRTDPDTRICAHGSITRNGETIDIGDELCT